MRTRRHGVSRAARLAGGAAELPPVADFSAGSTSLAVDGSTVLTDLSTNTPTSWLWEWRDPAGANEWTALQESTSQNPTLYSSQDLSNTAGVFDIRLTATNGGGSDVEEKIGYITLTL